MRPELVYNLEYRNEAELSKLKPTKESIKEVPYVKNNPREKELANATGSETGDVR